MALLFPTDLCWGRPVSRPVSLTVPHNHVGLHHEVPLASEESLAETGEAASLATEQGMERGSSRLSTACGHPAPNHTASPPLPGPPGSTSALRAVWRELGPGGRAGG